MPIVSAIISLLVFLALGCLSGAGTAALTAPVWTGQEGGYEERFAGAHPSPDWEPVLAPGWPSYPEFHLHLPPGWEWKEIQGIDSYAGEVTGDGVWLLLDYGGFSGPFDPEDDPEHDYAVFHEEIAGLEAQLYISLDDRAGYTGVYFPLKTNRGYIGLTLIGEGLTQEQQHAAVSVFRGIRFSEIK